MRRGLAAAIVAIAAIAGCDRINMVKQREFRTWDRNSFLRHDREVQLPPEGVVAHGLPGAPAPQPARIDEAMLVRGQQVFDANCIPCHGLSGDGNGIIVQRGMPHPPQLWDPKLVRAKASLFYETITNGHGMMYSYADRVPPADRWAVAAYIRALQAAAATPVANLSAQDKAMLAKEGG